MRSSNLAVCEYTKSQRKVPPVSCIRRVHVSKLFNFKTSWSESNRYFSSSTSSSPKEFSLKTPTGHIAGKVWNEEAPVAVLCLHGFQDNAGSFDRLIPLLPDHLCSVAIDLPGHGWSSHDPPGVGHVHLHYMISVERVIRHFGWKQVIILGHSMGGGLGMLYAGTRPSLVHSLMTIDLVKPVHLPSEKLPKYSGKSLDKVWEIEHKLLHKPRPTYSYDELLTRALKSHQGSLSKEEMEILLQRGSEQLPDGRYAFTYSLNLVIPSIWVLDSDQVMAFASSLRCRIMVLKAKSAKLYEDQKYADATLEVYRQSSSEFEYHEIPGGHHVHLSQPETVVPYVTRFLTPTTAPHNNRGEDGGSLVTQGLGRL
ncbi:Alpha/beta hydrolase fold-1 [Trinorchestia longiramus]|nr:Alpha/beta hydrolase fold-1 [Trinorchestia longiramus]